jgi:hypothetical protein
MELAVSAQILPIFLRIKNHALPILVLQVRYFRRLEHAQDASHILDGRLEECAELIHASLIKLFVLMVLAKAVVLDILLPLVAASNKAVKETWSLVLPETANLAVLIPEPQLALVSDNHAV